ncbi:MAG: DUF3291 domain-containing protein [Pseudomonadota bacterium]
MTLIHPPAPDWHLAEVNVARLKAPADDPLVAPFIDAIDKINALAARMPGFVWRHVNTPADQTGMDPLVVYNASTWTDAPALETFVWGTLHARFYERRAEWFDALGAMHFAMWWVPPCHRPPVSEAMERLAKLDADGPSSDAFGWEQLPDATRWRGARCEPA